MAREQLSYFNVDITTKEFERPLHIMFMGFNSKDVRDYVECYMKNHFPGLTILEMKITFYDYADRYTTPIYREEKSNDEE